MTWLASTDSVKELKAAVEELRVQVDACGQKAEQAQRAVGPKVEAVLLRVDAIGRRVAVLEAVSRRSVLGRLTWLVTGK